MVRTPKNAGPQRTLVFWLVPIMIAGLLMGAPAFASTPETEATLAVPQPLFAVLQQALQGPRYEALALDYAKALSASRASTASLSPRWSVSAGVAGDVDTGVIAGPGVTIKLPTGQGETELDVGVAAKLDAGQTLYAPQATLSTRIPLLAGKDLRRANADYSQLAAEEALAEGRKELVSTAAKAYLDYVQTLQEQQIASEALQLAEAEFSKGSDLLQAGTLSRTELAKLRTALYDATDAEIAARRSVVVSRDALLALLGGGDIAESLPAEALESKDGQSVLLHSSVAELPQDEQGWQALALQNRGYVSMAKQAVDQAEQALRKVKATATKEVALTAGATWPKKLTATETDLRTDVQVGLQGTIFFGDATRREKVTAQQIALEQAEQALRDLKRRVETEVGQALYTVEATERALEQAQTQLQQEQALLAVTEDRLAKGLAIRLDVQAAELAVAQQEARVQHLTGQLITDKLALWQAAGLEIVELSAER